MDSQIFLENMEKSSERSDLRFEAWKPVFVKRDMGVYMLDLLREICKPVLILDFTAHSKMKSLSEYGLRLFLKGLSYLNVKNTEQVAHPCTASSVYEIFGTKIESNKEISRRTSWNFKYFNTWLTEKLNV